MYPQTHVYFAERVLGKRGDIITLGSILPDMIIGSGIDHYEAHCKGMELYGFACKDHYLLDLDQAVSTHGFKPRGLDFYGDEKYQNFEKGYCFEKARSIIGRTVEACSIPEEMGWWKAHNIIEMGVETIVSSQDYYCTRLESALGNKRLITGIDSILQQLCGKDRIDFIGRVDRFSGYIEKDRATAESLAKKFSKQMRLRHNVEIDIKKTISLINDAAELVSFDLSEFFSVAAGLVKDNIKMLFETKR